MVGYVRITLLKPRPGSDFEVLELLEELDARLAGAPGLIFSAVLRQESSRRGRVSLWLSKEEANREATTEQTLSLRSRLLYLSLETEETFMEVQSGHAPQGFAAILNAPTEALILPDDSSQSSRPAA